MMFIVAANGIEIGIVEIMTGAIPLYRLDIIEAYHKHKATSLG